MTPLQRRLHRAVAIAAAELGSHLAAWERDHVTAAVLAALSCDLAGGDAPPENAAGRLPLLFGRTHFARCPRCGHEDVLAATALYGVPAGTVLHVGEARACRRSPYGSAPVAHDRRWTEPEVSSGCWAGAPCAVDSGVRPWRGCRTPPWSTIADCRS